MRESPPSTGDREPRRERSGGLEDSGRRDGRDGGRAMRSSDTELLHRLEDYSQVRTIIVKYAYGRVHAR